MVREGCLIPQNSSILCNYCDDLVAVVTEPAGDGRDEEIVAGKTSGARKNKQSRARLFEVRP